MPKHALLRNLVDINLSLALAILAAVLPLALGVVLIDRLMGKEIFTYTAVEKYELHPIHDLASSSSLVEAARAAGFAESVYIERFEGNDVLVLDDVRPDEDPRPLIESYGFGLGPTRIVLQYRFREIAESLLAFPTTMSALLVAQGLGLLVFGQYRIGKRSLPSPWRAPNRRTLGSAVLFGVLAVTGGEVIAYLQGLAGWSVKEQPWVENVLQGDVWMLGLVFLVIGVAVPVAEEVFFRGFAFSLLRQSCGLPWAAILSSVIFSGIHFNPSASLIYVFYGLVLAIAFHRTGTLLVPILIHSAVNFVGLFMIFGVK